MFVDEARVRVVAGCGGDGCVSFRREKFVPKGGPDGGDGGHGGSVVLVVDEGMRTLLDLRHRRLFEAERGRPGEGKQRSGRKGGDCLIRLPPGTIVRDATTGAWIADLVTPGERMLVARGGRGGKGNQHFKSSTRRTPRIATKGQEGEARELLLELRLLADVGLVGLPNVGKSTLLARVSNARPRIGDYPFTTLVPNLGIVAVADSFSLVMADIPGLVEGAHQGRGLGIRFLKHLERTRILLFLLDSLSENPAADLEVLRREVERFSQTLARRPIEIAISRCDLRPEGWSPPVIEGRLPLLFSSVTGRGMDDLLGRLRDLLQEQRDEPVGSVEIDAPGADLPFAFQVDREADLGESPWPRRSFVGPLSRWGELERQR